MLDWWNNASLFVVDGLLGWMLLLPRDAAIIGVAALSAVVLTAVRRYTTNQDMLGRIAHDKRRLRELLRGTTDRAARERIRNTRSQVMLRSLRAEGRPLLFSLVPIALLATWCVFRLEMLPPRGDEPIIVKLETPISKVGAAVHLLPQPGLTVADGYVREVQPATDPTLAPGGESGVKAAHGQATWILRGTPASQAYALFFRLDQRSYTHPLLIGQTRYAPPVDVHSDGVVTMVEMDPARLFGVLPGIEALAFPPWLVAYVLLTIPFTLVAKRVSKTW